MLRCLTVITSASQAISFFSVYVCGEVVKIKYSMVHVRGQEKIFHVINIVRKFGNIIV